MFVPKENTYSGSYDNDYVVLKNGKAFDPAPSQVVWNHSPDGFSWGYGGSGPAQLALGILLEEFNAGIAARYYQDFKREIIAGLPKEDPWKLHSADVYGWLSNYLQGKLNKVKERLQGHEKGSEDYRKVHHDFQDIVLELHKVTGTRFV